MNAARYQSFRNFFATGQLIAGSATALTLFPEGTAGEGGLLTGLIFAVGGFLAVIPVAAAVAYVAAWRAEKRGYVDPPPGVTRWGGAVVVGLAIGAVMVGGSLLARYLLA